MSPTVSPPRPRFVGPGLLGRLIIAVVSIVVALGWVINYTNSHIDHVSFALVSGIMVGLLLGSYLVLWLIAGWFNARYNSDPGYKEVELSTGGMMCVVLVLAAIGSGLIIRLDSIWGGLAGFAVVGGGLVLVEIGRRVYYVEVVRHHREKL